MSARDPKLAALSPLERARNEAARARHELLDIKHGLGYLGVEAGAIERALDAISLTLDYVHAARHTLWDAACDEMRSERCA